MNAHRWVEGHEGGMTVKDVCAVCGAVRVRRFVPGSGRFMLHHGMPTVGRYRTVGYAADARSVMLERPPACIRPNVDRTGVRES